MNVAALLQETPSEDASTRRSRSGSTSGGGGGIGGGGPNTGPGVSNAPAIEREREREPWIRTNRPSTNLPLQSSNAGLRSIMHSPTDTRSNIPEGYRNAPPPPMQSSPSSHTRGPPPLSPLLSMKESKNTAMRNTSPSSSRQGYGAPHGHGHSSHPSPAMASLRPSSQTAPAHGEPASAWSGPPFGSERERRGSASSGIGPGGVLLRSSELSKSAVINRTPTFLSRPAASFSFSISGVRQGLSYGTAVAGNEEKNSIVGQWRCAWVRPSGEQQQQHATSISASWTGNGYTAW